jgi:hypothetical protein
VFLLKTNQIAVDLNGDDLAGSFRRRGSQNADPRSDFDHQIPLSDIRFLNNFIENVFIGQEILSQTFDSLNPCLFLISLMVAGEYSFSSILHFAS